MSPAEGTAARGGERRRPVRRTRRRLLSPLTWRVLAVNVLALALLVGGLLFLDEYRKNLTQAEMEALRTQGEIVAGALGESAVVIDESGAQLLVYPTARQIVRRLVEPARTRARLFAPSGELIVDSRLLTGPGGFILVAELPPPRRANRLERMAQDIYDWVLSWLPVDEGLEAYHEDLDPAASDFPEVTRALLGENSGDIRRLAQIGRILTVAVPVQRYKQVTGALLLSRDDREIEAAVREVRFDILRVFGVALAVTVLLSLYLAGTVTRPIRRLALAAERVRRGPGRQYRIPDMADRGDEIGELAGALREMTDALWARMDAIEGFAADVAHEIKNPLSSLRSAVETVQRVDDPEQQRKLMAIIQDDVRRLDRLISDISDASRLDAELSRAESEEVDLARLLATLVDIYGETGGGDGPRLVLDLPARTNLKVRAIEDRLGQVFRNLIVNAQSFSPPGGTIAVSARREAGDVVAVIEDEGPGIPPENLEDIFQRFYSKRPAGEKFGTHSGLGLSISQQIVQAAGGTIRAENRTRTDGSSAGARFVVRLPAG